MHNTVIINTPSRRYPEHPGGSDRNVPLCWLLVQSGVRPPGPPPPQEERVTEGVPVHVLHCGHSQLRRLVVATRLCSQ